MRLPGAVVDADLSGTARLAPGRQLRCMWFNVPSLGASRAAVRETNLGELRVCHDRFSRI